MRQGGPFSDRRLQIGFITQQKVLSLLQHGDITSEQAAKFYSGVREFFEKAVEYAMKNLPLSDDLLKAAHCVNIQQRELLDRLHLEYFYT